MTRSDSEETFNLAEPDGPSNMEEIMFYEGLQERETDLEATSSILSMLRACRNTSQLSGSHWKVLDSRGI
jgi:hypothetical protein